MRRVQSSPPPRLPHTAQRTASHAAGTWHPLLELTLTRMREFLRQPEAVFWVFVFPILLAFALGLAFRNTVSERLRVAVESTTPQAATLAATLSRAPDVQAEVMPAEVAAQALRAGKVALVVQVTDVAALSYRFDPTRSESRLARFAVDDALQRAAGRADRLAVREDTNMEPGARYIDFLVPGLIGLNLMGSGIWGLGFALVQARAQKLLKRLRATPMRRWHFLLSYMLSRLTFLLLEVFAILGSTALAFGVSVHGSWLSMLLIVILGACTFAGLGLLTGSRARTTEGVAGLMNLVMLPMWLLSGTFFSAARFPDFLQPFVKILPLTALNDALRAVINDGLALAATLPQLGILLGWAVLSLWVALRLFRWQ